MFHRWRVYSGSGSPRNSAAHQSSASLAPGPRFLQETSAASLIASLVDRYSQVLMFGSTAARSKLRFHPSQPGLIRRSECRFWLLLLISVAYPVHLAPPRKPINFPTICWLIEFHPCFLPPLNPSFLRARNLPAIHPHPVQWTRTLNSLPYSTNQKVSKPSQTILSMPL